MKSKIKMIATFLLLATAPFALAQRGGGGVHSSGAGFMSAGHDSTKIDSRRDSDMESTGIQREAFASCMMATEAVRKTGRSMGSSNYWNARHGIYDLSSVYRNNAYLQSTVTDMAVAHQQFLKVLSQDQDTALGPNLSKLEQLQTSLNLEMSKLDGELMAVKPDKFRVSTGVYEIGKTVDKWFSEHKKIAKKIGISKP